MTKRGLFIVVEGTDGAGSTTQVHMLCDYLKSLGRRPKMTAEPTGHAIGKLIRQLLKGSELDPQALPRILALLYAADRIWHDAQDIEPALAAGEDIVCDRYLMSSLVYQGIYVPQDWVLSLNQYAKKADLTILVDCSVEVAAARRTARGGDVEIFDDDDIQRRLRDRYLQLAKELNVQIADGSGSPREVGMAVQKIVDEQLSK